MPATPASDLGAAAMVDVPSGTHATLASATPPALAIEAAPHPPATEASAAAGAGATRSLNHSGGFGPVRPRTRARGGPTDASARGRAPHSAGVGPIARRPPAPRQSSRPAAAVLGLRPNCPHAAPCSAPPAMPDALTPPPPRSYPSLRTLAQPRAPSTIVPSPTRPSLEHSHTPGPQGPVPLQRAVSRPPRPHLQPSTAPRWQPGRAGTADSVAIQPGAAPAPPAAIGGGPDAIQAPPLEVAADTLPRRRTRSAAPRPSPL